MTNGLTSTQTKILTWVIYALIFIQSGVIGWLAIDRQNLPNQFVRLERYKSDKADMQHTLNEIRGDTRDTRKLLEKIYYKGE